MKYVISFLLYISSVTRFLASGENHSTFMSWDERIFLLLYQKLSCKYIIMIIIFLFIMSLLSLVLHYGTSYHFPTPTSEVVSIQYFHANKT